MPEYPFILLILLISAIILHRASGVKLFSSNKHLIVFYLIFLAIGIVWDNYAIYRGHWLYTDKFLTGIKIGYMPLEDYAFGIIVTYFGLVLYKIIEKYYSK